MKKKSPFIPPNCDMCNVSIDGTPVEGFWGFSTTKEGYIYCGRCTNIRNKKKENPVWKQENLVDKIAHNCGWLPLELNEKMTVTFDGKKRYEIKRIK